MFTSHDSKPTVEVCFSPALFPYIQTEGDFSVVVVDILRATTSFCAALHYG
ncbi:MAG: 2-phosphosulfolactate phosphatase, partial [Bacteroidales bacterium]|nr:2-phosphosulfolactate phosphatase [Bacteroidales bacterium]